MQFIYLLTHSLSRTHSFIHSFMPLSTAIVVYYRRRQLRLRRSAASASASLRAVIKTTLVIRPRSPLSLSLSVSVLLSLTLTPTLPVPLVATGIGIGFWFGSCRIRATPCSSRIYGRWLRLTKLSKLSSQSPTPFRSSASTFTLLRNAETFTIQDYEIFIANCFIHFFYRVDKVLNLTFLFNK